MSSVALRRVRVVKKRDHISNHQFRSVLKNILKRRKKKKKRNETEIRKKDLAKASLILNNIFPRDT